ncbi:hypothetical protein TNCV_4103541 [Trichonephila clavipes]|nr:hypothetical protein TNCV_4103541 [Trichonephila clavipes]
MEDNTAAVEQVITDVVLVRFRYILRDFKRGYESDAKVQRANAQSLDALRYTVSDNISHFHNLFLRSALFVLGKRKHWWLYFGPIGQQ